MPVFECNEFPVVDDQNVLAFCFHSQHIRTAAGALIVSITEQAGSRPIGKADLVALMLLTRLAECLLSFELLTSRGCERDAAVLLVTLTELSLDLRYLETRPGQVEVWVAHDKRRRKPWKVADQIEALYANENDRDAAERNYELCSMVKHGNPAGGNLTLPIGIEGRMVVHRLRDTGDFLAVYAFAAAAAVQEALNAAARMWTQSGFDVGAGCEAANEAWKQIQALSHQHVKEMLADLQGK
jgi:hypothetical protein